jgi:hypothetical protein
MSISEVLYTGDFLNLKIIDDVTYDKSDINLHIA